MCPLGKTAHLNRILAFRERRVLTVAVDHMINYPLGFPGGLLHMETTLARIIEGGADALTMNKGIALRYMQPHAGRIPLIIQSMALRPEEPDFADTATVEEVVGMGADAIAVAMFVYCNAEMKYLRHLADVVRRAAPFGLPVIPHIYPLASGDERHTVLHDPEHVFYAARVGLEMGADIIKVPYTGNVASFRDIVNTLAVPIVAAGGPRCASLEDAEKMACEIGQSGAAGATMGRNVWEFEDIPQAIQRLKAAINGQ
ncbi:MAG: aldolase [Candidatus Hydrogenedentes bacterium]|nr:aldolase [Candidatus Hydrogenedentota bacterium]